MEKTNKNLIEIIKFTLFSLSAGIIQFGSFTLLTEVFQLDNYWLTYLPSLVLSVLWNFTLNRKFTFKSANNVPLAMLKVAAYYAVFTPLSTWLGDLAIGNLATPDNAAYLEYIVLAVTMIINFVTEFLFTKFLVFAPKYDVVKKTDADTTNIDNKD
jgi:putative flippase GtrA